jgi:hypothetical protein
MSLPDKLLEKAFYWGPLFVGIVSLIVGVIFARTVVSVEGDIPLAKLQLDGASKSISQRPGTLIAKTNTVVKVGKPTSLQETPSQKKNLDNSPNEIQKNKKQSLNSSLAEKPKEGIGTDDAKNAIPPKKPEQEQIVRVTVPQLVSLHSEQIGGHAPLAMTGFNQTAFVPRRIGFEHKGAELAHWGQLSQFGLTKSIERTEYVSVMANAEALGDNLGGRGQNFIQGLTVIKTRSIRPLVAFYGEKIGHGFFTSYRGLDRSGNSGSILQKSFLSNRAIQFGGLSAFASSGLNKTTDGSEAVFKEFKITSLGEALGQDISIKHLKGVNRAVVHAEQMKQATIALAVPEELTLKGKNSKFSQADLPCSTRFYEALQDLRSTKISAIRTVAKPISKFDKTLPGRWIFSPPSFKTRSACKKYKYKKSGRRKCVKWGKVVPKNTAYTPEEQDYILTAQKIITGKGRHPVVKPRSPSHWVINIVAQNLNSYSSQKPHPALCTGALGMVDYFEGNLKRFKRHMTSIATLNEQSKAHILNQVERLNASLKNQSALKVINAEIDSVTQNQKIIVSSYDPLTVNGQAVAALFGEDVGLEILSRDQFIDQLKLTRSLIKSRKPHIHASTYSQFLRLATLLEATYYIQKTHDKYKVLEQKLFGSLRGIRTAHTSHCNCSN